MIEKILSYNTDLCDFTQYLMYFIAEYIYILKKYKFSELYYAKIT